MKVYMAVTVDEFELPLAVRDSTKEIGEMFGVTRSTVSSTISRNSGGTSAGVKFVRVEIEYEIGEF